MSNGQVRDSAIAKGVRVRNGHDSAALRVEFKSVRGGRELVLLDEVSGLIVARVSLDAEQFLRVMNGYCASVQGWLLPSEARSTLGRATVRATLYVDSGAGVKAVQSWACEAAEFVGADFVQVHAVEDRIRASFTFSSDAEEPRRDVEPLRAALVEHAAASDLSVWPAPGSASPSELTSRPPESTGGGVPV